MTNSSGKQSTTQDGEKNSSMLVTRGSSHKIIKWLGLTRPCICWFWLVGLQEGAQIADEIILKLNKRTQMDEVYLINEKAFRQIGEWRGRWVTKQANREEQTTGCNTQATWGSRTRSQNTSTEKTLRKRTQRTAWLFTEWEEHSH